MSGQNSNPGWVDPQNGQPGTKPLAPQWNSLWSSKVDATNGYSTNQNLVNPSISGGSANFQNLSVQGRPVPVNGSYLGLPTPITSSTGATYSANQMLQGAIWRTGPTANFSDYTDTAQNILNAYAVAYVNTTFDIFIANGTSYELTLTGGTGVTISAISAIASSDWGIIEARNGVLWRGVFTNVGSTPAVTLARIGSFGL